MHIGKTINVASMASISITGFQYWLCMFEVGKMDTYVASLITFMMPSYQRQNLQFTFLSAKESSIR
jgi:hypothetical protein